MYGKDDNGDKDEDDGEAVDDRRKTKKVKNGKKESAIRDRVDNKASGIEGSPTQVRQVQNDGGPKMRSLSRVPNNKITEDAP